MNTPALLNTTMLCPNCNTLIDASKSNLKTSKTIFCPTCSDWVPLATNLQPVPETPVQRYLVFYYDITFNACYAHIALNKPKKVFTRCSLSKYAINNLAANIEWHESIESADRVAYRNNKSTKSPKHHRTHFKAQLVSILPKSKQVVAIIGSPVDLNYYGPEV